MNILLIVSVFSFFGIIFIIVSKIPLLMKLQRQPEVILHPQPLLRKIIHLKFSSYFNFIIIINWLEKNLRKLRILFLKIDQWVMTLIKKMRERSQILTIRYHAWVDQQKVKKIKVRTSPMRDFKTEEDVLIQLLTQNPKDILTYKKLGYLYLAQKNFHDAREAFEQILKLKPRDKEAKEQLSKLPPVE